jgi:hypothetical protein
VVRYQTQTLYAQHGPVKTYQGLDPLTGLPVLLYTFPGKPLLGIGDLVSDNIPGILASSYDGKEGLLVVAYSREYQPLLEPLQADDVLPLLLDSARALRDAAEAGVVHGDLRPERFLRAGQHHLIEGYGVRWIPQRSSYSPPEPSPSYAGDVFSWAKSLLFLCGPHLPAEAGKLLSRCLGEPEARPLAGELYQAIAALPPPKVAIPATIPTTTPTTAFDRFDIELSLGDDLLATPFSQPPVVAHPQPSEREPLAPARPDRPELRTAGDFPSAEPLLRKKAQEPEAPGFVKMPPPGATYRTVSGDGRPAAPISAFSKHLRSFSPSARKPLEAPIDLGQRERTYRRLVLLVLLLILATGLALLAFWRQGFGNALGPGGNPVVRFIVTVGVVPDLQQVRLVVVESPPGSRLRPGNEVATVPGPAVLDQAGLWRLQARFQNLTSEVVVVRVPDERAITITLREPDTP